MFYLRDSITTMSYKLNPFFGLNLETRLILIKSSDQVMLKLDDQVFDERPRFATIL